MASIHATRKDIEEAILQLKEDDQRRLVADIYNLLGISIDDLLLLRVAEPSFGFWNNPEDAVYDTF